VGLFEITELDAAVAAEGLARLSPRRRRRIRSRGRDILRRIGAIFPGDRNGFRLDPAREEEWDAFFEDTSRIACPFLVPAADGAASETSAQDLADRARWPRGYTCAIYSHRPYTCRTFGLALADRGRIVSPACRLNFRTSKGRAARARQFALPAFDPADAELAAEAQRRIGLDRDSATILPAVAAGLRYTFSGPSRRHLRRRNDR